MLLPSPGWAALLMFPWFIFAVAVFFEGFAFLAALAVDFGAFAVDLDDFFFLSASAMFFLEALFFFIVDTLP